jgi:2-polyprenyl-3-methyl-5-hydroxy-6-metoxy-1,4-benzoquinol methylase
MSGKARLWVKYLFFPGIDVAFRKRMRLAQYFEGRDIRTLDAGCGNGAFCFAAARKGNRVLGINIRPDEVARCEEFRDFLGIDREQCQFEVLNVYDILSLKMHFDQIICFEVIEHLMRDDEVLAKFYDLLSLGGTLHLCTPYYFTYYGSLSAEEDGGHVRWGYTFEVLEEKLSKIGFSVVAKDVVLGSIGMWVLGVQQALARGLRYFPRSVAEATGCLFLLLCLPLMVFDRPKLEKTLSIYVKARKHG